MTEKYKILAGQSGELGDILIGLPSIRHLYQHNLCCDITLCVNKKYSKIIPFLRGLDYINNIYISDGYDDFPTEIDINYLQYKKFDKIYNPMQTHSRVDWYNYFHYTEEAAISHGIIQGNDEERKFFNKKIDLIAFEDVVVLPSKIIGFAPYANAPDRCLSKEDAQFIVDLINKLGYKLIFLGLNNNLNNIMSLETNSFYNAVSILPNLLGLITVDTVWSWLASGYNNSVFGLYSINYPDMVQQFSHFPKNPNATYVLNKNIKQLHREMIEQQLTNWVKIL